MADSIPMDNLDKELVTSKSERRVKSQSAQAKRRPRVLGAQSKKLEEDKTGAMRNDNSDCRKRITRSKSQLKKVTSAESHLVSFAPNSKGEGGSATHGQKSNNGALATSRKLASSSSDNENDAPPLSPSQSVLSMSSES